MFVIILLYGREHTVRSNRMFDETASNVVGVCTRVSVCVCVCCVCLQAAQCVRVYSPYNFVSFFSVDYKQRCFLSCIFGYSVSFMFVWATVALHCARTIHIKYSFDWAVVWVKWSDKPTANVFTPIFLKYVVYQNELFLECKSTILIANILHLFLFWNEKNEPSIYLELQNYKHQIQIVANEITFKSNRLPSTLHPNNRPRINCLNELFEFHWYPDQLTNKRLCKRNWKTWFLSFCDNWATIDESHANLMKILEQLRWRRIVVFSSELHFIYSDWYTNCL